MEVRLCLGGIHFLFRAENDLEINEELFPFLVQNEERTDLVVQISRDWGNVRLPETEKSGQDAILEYYVESDARTYAEKAVEEYRGYIEEYLKGDSKS